MSSKGEENSKKEETYYEENLQKINIGGSLCFNGNRTLGMQHQCADPGYCKGAAGEIAVTTVLQ